MVFDKKFPVLINCMFVCEKVRVELLKNQKLVNIYYEHFAVKVIQNYLYIVTFKFLET